MKILFLSIKVPEASARDRITYSFIMKEMRALLEAGVEVYFYSDAFEDIELIDGIRCFGRGRRWRDRLGAIALMLRHPLYFLPRLMTDWRATVGIAVTEARIGAVIQHAGIDLIHTHFLWPLGECCELVSRDLGIPIVATLRGAELWREPSLQYGSMLNPLFRKNFESAKQTIRHFTVPNSDLLDKLESEHGVERSRVSLLFNGVERIELDLPQRKLNVPLRFIAVGRLIRRKNYLGLLEALTKVRNHNFELEIYGEGPEAEALTDFCAANDLDQVSIRAEVPKNVLYERVRDADALIHPSWIEGLPNVVIESLALGTPVIASDIPPHRDVIQPGYNGYLFDLSAPEELARTVDEVLGTPARLAGLTPNCRASAKSFDLDTKIRGYLEIYERLVCG